MTRENVRNEVVPVLVLLQAAEGHLGAGDVLLGVLKVVELEGFGSAQAHVKGSLGRLFVLTYQRALVPGDALLLVGVGVGVTVNGTAGAAEQAVERRADLVAAASLKGVALRATRLEEVGTLLLVTCGCAAPLAVCWGKNKKSLVRSNPERVRLCCATRRLSYLARRPAIRFATGK